MAFFCSTPAGVESQRRKEYNEVTDLIIRMNYGEELARRSPMNLISVRKSEHVWVGVHSSGTFLVLACWKHADTMTSFLVSIFFPPLLFSWFCMKIFLNGFLNAGLKQG